MLKLIAETIRLKEQEFENWYQKKLESTTPCLYTSVDLRYSGKKIVPVDTNLFPAGFNNVSLDKIDTASSLAKKYINKISPDIKSILLIGEDHSRNPYYMDNLKTIELILNKAGYHIKIGSLTATEHSKNQGNNHSDICISSITKHNNKLQIDDFIPNLIILNNDLSSGMPDLLKNIDQKVIPHPNNGWFMRRKSNHFKVYNKLVTELEELFSLPSFLLSTEFDICEGVNFKSKHGMDELAKKVEVLLLKIKEKYEQNNIHDTPYVVVKSDYGTYGMGIMMIKSADEIFSINKKLRNQMHITKSNIVNERVIIQEGVKTFDKIGNASAEPLLYLINHQQIEFMYRIHKTKDEYSNLNSVGMEIANNHKFDCEDYYYCCNLVARIASLAAALELQGNGS
ncbi:MAG: glutamate--cysteine ligase [Rickettsiales bacterium]|jgi:glutamate--cysteine ligase|nr:glutamate--cysteine ligase [Rickettsiales bacterium]